MDLISDLGRAHVLWSNKDWEPQLLYPPSLEPTLCTKRNHHSEKPVCHTRQHPSPITAAKDTPRGNEDPAQPKNNNNKKNWIFLKHDFPPCFCGKICSTCFLSFLTIFGCTGSSLLHRLFSSCCKQGLLFGCGAQASHCSGFSFAKQGL